jgi:hypothetical protein
MRRDFRGRKRQKEEDVKSASDDLNSLFGPNESKNNENDKKEDIQNVADNLNSLFGPSEPSKPEVEILSTEVFRLSEEEKQEILANPSSSFETEGPKTNAGKILNFIKDHVRPDIGIGPFKEGEEPDFKNDDLYEIGQKLRQNLKVGLKITIKF